MDMAGLAIIQSPDRLPHMLVRRVNPPSHPSTRCSRTTVATLSVEVLVVILSVFMVMRVMWLFSQNDDGRDGDASTDEKSHPTGPHQNI